MFKFNSMIEKLKDKANSTLYTIKIETDNYEQYKYMQDIARECVDGKHKENLIDVLKGYGLYKDSANSTSGNHESNQTLNLWNDGYINLQCISCPNHPKNGGSGLCNCILGCTTITCATANESPASDIYFSTLMGKPGFTNSEEKNSNNEQPSKD